jgi:3-oxoacyl-[acyl-carrier protein] reductase
VDLGLRGRPALVAAASRGLGFASAMALAREGARLAICARDVNALREAADQIREATGSDVTPIVADASNAGDAIRFVREGAAALGGCHVLVANAGGPPPGRAIDLSDRDFLEAIELSFLSVVRMAREALPHMRAAGYGRIVAISSSSVKEPIPGLALSNAARAAATGFLKTLAREVAPDGITVNAVLPGRFRTRRVHDLAAARGRTMDEELGAQAADVPMGRLGEPGELGEVVAFLASDRASYVTGAMLSVDGGLFHGLF